MNEENSKKEQEPRDEKEPRNELIAMYKEHWEHARHCEKEIFWFTNIYAVIVAAILAFMKQTSLCEHTDFGIALLLAFFGLILSVFGLLIVIALTQGFHNYMMNIETICYRWNLMEFFVDPEKAFYFKRIHRWFFELSTALFVVLFLYYLPQVVIPLAAFHEHWKYLILVFAFFTWVILKGLYHCEWKKCTQDCRD